MALPREGRLLDQAVTAPPTSEARLAFRAKLQRLFSPNYKFASLIALADHVVERGRDDGSRVRLTTHQIAEKFIELHWQQSVP